MYRYPALKGIATRNIGGEQMYDLVRGITPSLRAAIRDSNGVLEVDKAKLAKDIREEANDIRVRILAADHQFHANTTSSNQSGASPHAWGSPGTNIPDDNMIALCAAAVAIQLDDTPFQPASDEYEQHEPANTFPPTDSGDDAPLEALWEAFGIYSPPASASNRYEQHEPAHPSSPVGMSDEAKFEASWRASDRYLQAASASDRYEQHEPAHTSYPVGMSDEAKFEASWRASDRYLQAAKSAAPLDSQPTQSPAGGTVIRSHSPSLTGGRKRFSPMERPSKSRGLQLRGKDAIPHADRQAPAESKSHFSSGTYPLEHVALSHPYHPNHLAHLNTVQTASHYPATVSSAQWPDAPQPLLPGDYSQSQFPHTIQHNTTAVTCPTLPPFFTHKTPYE
ncbi:hypothetical protein BXZ70DRAFT_952068 [Cristinia sonorae]|uniref:Uncharacterized protein n=1 Tax=Cristinia sonorae TaxID=1940300 RepID=A0A8K0XLU0_9AGAR|nr:hypothetical protein BXZ70DRAFT_952068 [Cristinia sonorae]